MNPGQGDCEAAPKGSTLWDGWNGARRFGATDCRPLNKGGRALLLAKWVNRGLPSSGDGAGDNLVRVGIRGRCPWSDRKRQTSDEAWERLPRDSTKHHAE